MAAAGRCRGAARMKVRPGPFVWYALDGLSLEQRYFRDSAVVFFQKRLDRRLLKASEDGRTDAVKELLDKGADVHAGNDMALRHASWNGHTETVKALLKAGADVRALGDAALLWAAGMGHTETVKLLLDAGADVHARYDYALHWASLNGHTGTVKLLREWIEREKAAPQPDKAGAGEAEYASWALVVPATRPLTNSRDSTLPLIRLPMPMAPRQIPNLRLPDPL